MRLPEQNVASMRTKKIIECTDEVASPTNCSPIYGGHALERDAGMIRRPSENAEAKRRFIRQFTN